MFSLLDTKLCFWKVLTKVPESRFQPNINNVGHTSIMRFLFHEHSQEEASYNVVCVLLHRKCVLDMTKNCRFVGKYQIPAIKNVKKFLKTLYREKRTVGCVALTLRSDESGRILTIREPRDDPSRQAEYSHVLSCVQPLHTRLNLFEHLIILVQTRFNLS